MVIWEPDDPTRQDQPIITYQKIIDGEFDAYIHGWAAAAAAYGQPVIVRFAHEMDGKWMPWGIDRHRGDSADQFINAWRHVWNIFKGPYGEGAVNVRFLWSPFSPGDWMADAKTGIYPGNKYVDYVGFTGFNWNDSQHPWAAMQQIYHKPVAALRHIANKPIIAAETGTVNKRTSNGASMKPTWISSGYPDVYSAYPDIVAIVYFNVNMSNQRNWRLDVPEQAQTAYRNLLSDSRFQGRLTWSIPKPPVITRPEVGLATGVKAKASEVRLAWTVTSGTPIYKYEAAVDTGNGWSPLQLFSPAKPTAVLSVDPSRVTRVRVRARDRYGRTSPWRVSPPITALAAQEKSAAVTLHGKFTKSHLPKAFGKSVEWSTKKGNSATFAFTGRAVGFVSTRGPDRGKAWIYLDGVKIGKINLYHRKLQYGEVVFATNTSPGAHTLLVQVAGKGTGSGQRIDIDGFLALR